MMLMSLNYSLIPCCFVCVNMTKRHCIIHLLIFIVLLMLYDLKNH